MIRGVLERRSVRFFIADAPIPTEDLRMIVRCGAAAPSSKHAQPWRFHVVTDCTVLAAFADAAVASPYADSYVPHDPLTGRPRPEWESTVVESAAVIRSCAAAIFIENKGIFSRGRQTMVGIPSDALAASLTAYGLEILGIGGAIENLLLAADALGIGATFIGDIIIAEDVITERLSLTGDLMGVVAFGYAETKPPPRPERMSDPGPDHVVWH